MHAKVAILPWGNEIEDFLDTIGISVDEFATGMSGGWLFGYSAALRAVGIDTCIVCFSGRTRAARRIVNASTGTATIVLPSSRWFSAGAALLGNPDRATSRHGPAARLQSLVRYAATPKTSLSKVLVSEGCTHVLCQEYENPRFDIVSRLALRPRIAVHASFQGGTPAITSLERRVRRRSILAADGLVVAASPEIDRLQRTYGSALPPVAQICNPLDLDEWRPVDRSFAREAIGLPEDAFVAICHCRIDYRRKGLDILLAAWRSLAARQPERDARLHLIGSGADDELLAAEIARDPVPGLTWDRGYSLDRAQMRRRLSAADVYVLASRHEGFPVAPLEAMACGLPVILSDAAAAADIIPEGATDGGIRVPAGNAEALATAIGKLAADASGRRSMALASRARVTRLASIEAVGAQLAAFLGIAPNIN